ncbi:uncharacterized protein LOC143471387 [Clavelina lepadiformis]|uniref:uncharacterized protein LOC143471387 n=1 Tax=Clavelina lepadiformis TaxID=159417 RepID=UPI004041D195
MAFIRKLTSVLLNLRKRVVCSLQPITYKERWLPSTKGVVTLDPFHGSPCVTDNLCLIVQNTRSSGIMQAKLVGMSQRTAQLENRYRRNSETFLFTKKEENLADNHPHRISRRSPSSDDTQLTTTGTGVPYIRWGRRECSGTSNELVYNGYAAGSYYSHTGGSSQYCLHHNVTYSPGRYLDGWQGSGRLYGVEYRDSSWVNTLFDLSLTEGNSLNLHSIPCAIYLAQRRSNQLMIPGRDICPDGWTKEYTGYMMGSAHTAKHSTSPICVDDKPQVVPGTQGEQHGEYLFLIEIECNSLPCEPYIAGRELVCVVCTL